MRLVYLTMDGKAIVEKAKVRERIIEEPDGNHPKTNDSVWYDPKGRAEPAIVIMEGVNAPYGAKNVEDHFHNLLYEMEVRERGFKHQSVSKMWARRLDAMGQWLLKYGVFLVIILIAIVSFTTSGGK
jgi:hypothetical protein